MYDTVLMIDDVPEMIRAGGVVYVNLRSGDRVIRIAMPRHIYHAAVNDAIALLTGPEADATVARLPRRKGGRG